MKRNVRGLAVLAAVAVAAVLLIVGISSSDGPSEETAPPTTTATPTETVQLPAGPTPADVKTTIFERSFSECGSYSAARLAAKYKVASTSEEQVSIAVVIAWTKFLQGGQDAVEDGRAGCAQGFARG